MNEHFFSKDNTSVLKGVAILFMVFAHLFNNMELCGFSHPLLYIEDEPLIHYMIFAMNPVDFFIVLSGYGLYYTYSQGKRNNIKRIIKLYIHYWITLVIFVCIGFFVVGSEKYPGSFLDLIYNFIGWKNSYNHETWFLFPYVLLTLSSTKIFTICDKFNPIKVFLFSFGLYILVRFSSRYSSGLIESYQLVKWVDAYLTLLFPFILGMLLSKCWDFSVFKERLLFKINKNYVLTFVLMILFVGIILVRYKYQSIFTHFMLFYLLCVFLCFIDTRG
jgi:peptidoglycan/LPS O-acetylase OafA/YrhL